MPPKDYHILYARTATALRTKELAARDGRPTWAVLRDALLYYEKVHPQTRTPPAQAFPKRGRHKQ